MLKNPLQASPAAGGAVPIRPFARSVADNLQCAMRHRCNHHQLRAFWSLDYRPLVNP
jgi:hypothetical protein